MKRAIASVLLLIVMALPATAQQGAGGRGGGRGTPPAIQVTPGGNLPQPTLQITPIGGQAEDARPAPLLTLTKPADWSGYALPTRSASTTDLSAYLTALPFEFSTDVAFQSSEEAYVAIVGFAADYLGAVVAPLYAGMVDGSAAQTADDAQLDQIIALFPEEAQALLASADSLSGVVFWGVMTDGVGVIYSGNCTGDHCAITIDNLQFTITNGSLGAYALYRPTTATNSDSALALVTSVYPALAGMELEAVAVESGWAFTSANINAQAPSVTAYYAGVVNIGEQALVYALAANGEGYVALLR